MTHDASPPSPPPVEPSPRRRRRWWRLSLGRAMVLIVVVAGPIGWEANRVSRMRRAVAVLVRPVAVERPALNLGLSRGASVQAKVSVLYNDLWRDGKYQFGPRLAWLPRWVRAAIDGDHFRRVSLIQFYRRPTPEDWAAIAALGSVDLQFRSTPVTDADLDGVARCGAVAGLDLRGTRITDATLGPIGRLTSLRRLDLTETATTAEGLTALSGLTQLEELCLGAKAGTDAGLARLRGMTRLRELSAAGSDADVSDAGLAHLTGLLNLEQLSFSTSRVTDVGIARLVGLPRLKELEINLIPTVPDPNLDDSPDTAGPRVRPFWETSEGAEQLGRLAHLETLNLPSLFVGDDCLRAIGRLTELRELVLIGPAITDAGVAALADLGRLEELTLWAPRLTDEGLRSLGRLTQLGSLTIVESPAITDAGLAHLRPLTGLGTLAVPAQITPEGIEAFQATLPEPIQITVIPTAPTLPAPVAP